MNFKGLYVFLASQKYVLLLQIKILLRNMLQKYCPNQDL